MSKPKIQIISKYLISKCSATIIFLLNFAVSMAVYSQQPQFGGQVDLGIIEYDDIREASGIAASRKNSHVFWTHNDSGDENRLFAFDEQGRHLGLYTIDGCENRDWEDMAIGPGPVDGLHYLYIGDIGDNLALNEIKTIYRIAEPDVATGQDTVTVRVDDAEGIHFRYPDEIHDAEALMVDPLTKDLYIVSKDTTQALVFRAPYPQSITETITLEAVAVLPMGWVVSGDISPDGLEILIKTYFAIYYWNRSPEESLGQAFDRPAVSLPYVLNEPQGEAVGWKSDGMGYYTISEELFNIPCHLYYYPRLPASPVWVHSAEPSDFILHQNVPNPFNDVTRLVYELPEPSRVELKIYNQLGEIVASLVDGIQSAGIHVVKWNGMNTGRRRVSSGSYIAYLRAGTFMESKRLLLLR